MFSYSRFSRFQRLRRFYHFPRFCRIPRIPRIPRSLYNVSIPTPTIQPHHPLRKSTSVHQTQDAPNPNQSYPILTPPPPSPLPRREPCDAEYNIMLYSISEAKLGEARMNEWMDE